MSTIAQHISHKVGLRRGMRVAGLLGGAATYQLLEQRQWENRTELIDALGWTRSKFYDWMALYEECWPEVEFELMVSWIVAEALERYEGRAPTPQRLVTWEAPSFG